MALADFLLGLPSITTRAEQSFGRTANGDGNRNFLANPATAAAPLVDESGRLIVRLANGAGFEAPVAGATGFNNAYGELQETGSAPQKDNLGLVVSAKVLEHALNFDAATLKGEAFITRMFGYSVTAGFVQLILKDESGGVNPPILADFPEVTIPIGAGQNFAFGNYYLGNGRINSVYIALSTTGPTYTPAAAAGLWFYCFGYV